MKRILLALLATAPLLASGASDLATGGGARAAIDFTVTVPRVMQLRVIGHPAALELTAADIERGTITIRGSSIEVLVNDRWGYTVHGEIANAAFTAVRVIGMPLGMRRPSMVAKPKPTPVPVEFELQLAAHAQPGRYAWPVALSLQTP